MSLTIAQMHLAPIMEQRARELELAFPGLIQWNSGRRTVLEQARAMAMNHLQNPLAYLTKNYIHASTLLEGLSMAPATDTVDGITIVFYEAMARDPHLVQSPHLQGNACDLQPMENREGDQTADGLLVIAWIRDCIDTVDFRTRESSLRRWHWAVRPSVNITSQV